MCIDCSAVHRGLGVHLTFVKSTQLDTNWTWLHLRNMQLGGNANAKKFFAQHNCTMTDAQQKYNSRAAMLYREKLGQASTQAMRRYGTKLHLEEGTEIVAEETNELDFFKQHENLDLLQNNTLISVEEKAFLAPNTVPNVDSTEKSASEDISNSLGPSVKLFDPVANVQTARKPTIGGRTAQSKRPGLGKKAGSLGAQRVKTNFDELEKSVAEARKQAQENKDKEVTKEEQEELATRLAQKYEQNLSQQAKKIEERTKQLDPSKATQAERLGMGFNARSGASHSALGDMKTIKQESKAVNITTSTETLSGETDLFFSLDEFYSVYANSKPSSRNDEVVVVAEPEPPKRLAPTSSRIANVKSDTKSSSIIEGEAQKKFGSAKAISSEQYFQDSTSDNVWERKNNLRRFEGSSSISSADYFGTEGSTPTSPTSSLSMRLTAGRAGVVDLDDVRESVRQGVNKVAGRLSSLANAAVSSIQDRYGL